MGMLVSELLATDERDITWLQSALDTAAELELSTIPPYLCGLTSIKDSTTTAWQLVKSVFAEEMLHLGLACNMLVGVGGSPTLPAPVYPGPLPGGVRPGLVVTLQGLTKQYVNDVYMGIELPEQDSTGPTIGSFYDAIAAAFEALQPAMDTSRQQTATINGEPLYVVDTWETAVKAISEIKEQGEGTALSPDAVDFGGELAHYYRFGEVYHGACYVEIDGQWSYSGDPVPWPGCWPMAPVPAGGWPDPSEQVQALLTQFDEAYGTILDNLRIAWGKGDPDALDTAITTMFQLPQPAGQLMQIALPDGSGNYGPDFLVVQ